MTVRGGIGHTVKGFRQTIKIHQRWLGSRTENLRMIFKSDEKPEQPAGQRVSYTSYCNGNIRGHGDKLQPFPSSKNRTPAYIILAFACHPRTPTRRITSGLNQLRNSWVSRNFVRSIAGRKCITNTLFRNGNVTFVRSCIPYQK